MSNRIDRAEPDDTCVTCGHRSGFHRNVVTDGCEHPTSCCHEGCECERFKEPHLRCSRKRRQRYTAYLDEGAPIVVFAYTTAGARAVAQGMTSARVVDVKRGDARMTLNPAGGWRLDANALERARRTLNLKLPVIVTTNSREGDTNGTYEFQARQQRHKVMLKSYLTPESASRVLWHELTHAAQAERAGSFVGWMVYCAEQQQGWCYDERPMELEARAAEITFANRHLTTAP